MLQMRQILRKLIPGSIVCTPFNNTRRRGYTLMATGSYSSLLAGAPTVKLVWRRGRDLNPR